MSMPDLAQRTDGRPREKVESVRITGSPWISGEIVMAQRGPMEVMVEVSWEPEGEYSDRLAAALELLIERVEAEALRLGADHVVGFRLDVDPFGQSVTLCASGSACSTATPLPLGPLADGPHPWGVS
jgi:uncharacterized protein YbjQ (UPF0145 family)